MKSKRLNNLGKINRDKTLNFTWDNKKLSGFEGDSLASALLANNIGIVGRSFKYHRPRGIFSSGVEESGALVTIGSKDRRDPNVRATTQELFDGLKASGQNAFPNVNFDLGGINNYIGRFFAAGFYYKTFMGIPPFEWGKGTAIWMLFEKLIRKAAGMGSASRLPDPDSYEHAHDFCDVIVVGSGPSGVAAAIEAAEKKLDVILVEQDSVLGGNQLSENDFSTSSIFNQLQSLGVKIMTRTTAFGLYDNCVVGLLERVTDHLSILKNIIPRQRFWTIRAKHIILGSGALERHIAFNNNDIPGVMTVNASKHYLNRYGVLTGEDIVIATNNDSVYETASELSDAGANVTVLDSRTNIEVNSKNNFEIRKGYVPYNINGRKKMKSQLDKNLNGNTLVPLLPNEKFSSQFMSLIKDLNEAKGSSRINNSARAMAHSDDFGMASRNYWQSTWELGELAKPFKALIRYKVATRNTCFYCSTHQIEHLRRLGVDEDKIKNIQDSDNNDAFTEAEKAALSFVDHMMIDASNIPNKVADNFKNHFTPKQMVEIALTATVMVSLNLFNDAFRVPIEDEVVGVGLDVPEL